MADVKYKTVVVLPETHRKLRFRKAEDGESFDAVIVDMLEETE
jgi:hypothetical protein